MPITYDNKEDIREVFLPRKNTITAADLNEIKEVVNNLEAKIKAMGGHYANYFNYATGQAPTLAAFEAQIGFPLINGAKFGDTIVFDNVGYTLAISVFADYNLMGFLKCSALILLDAAFQDNQIEKVYLPIATTLTTGVFQSNTTLTHVYIPECLFITIGSEFDNCNIQYFNAPIIQQIGQTTGFDNVFQGNTGNNVTVIVPLIHQTSNAGGLEGDLAYLDDNNTVTFDWDGDEVPEWIKCCSFITL
jgi:hypothetical protein